MFVILGFKYGPFSLNLVQLYTYRIDLDFKVVCEGQESVAPVEVPVPLKSRRGYWRVPSDFYSLP